MTEPVKDAQQSLLSSDPAKTDDPKPESEATSPETEAYPTMKGTEKAEGDDAGGEPKTETTSSESDSGDEKSQESADVPEKYEFKGDNLDATAVEIFEPVLRDLGITQDGADKLTEAFSAMVNAQKAARQEAVVAQAEQWKEEVMKDKVLGGENLDSTLAATYEIVSKYGSPELTNLLDATQLGSRIELVRFIHAISQELGEDSTIGGDTGVSSRKTEAELLEQQYPTMVAK